MAGRPQAHLLGAKLVWQTETQHGLGPSMLATRTHVCPALNHFFHSQGPKHPRCAQTVCQAKLLQWPYLLLLLNFGCSLLVLLVGLWNTGTHFHTLPKATHLALGCAMLSLLAWGRGRRGRCYAWAENGGLLVGIAISIHGGAAGTRVVILLELGGRERNTKPAGAFKCFVVVYDGKWTDEGGACEEAKSHYLSNVDDHKGSSVQILCSFVGVPYTYKRFDGLFYGFSNLWFGQGRWEWQLGGKVLYQSMVHKCLKWSISNCFLEAILNSSNLRWVLIDQNENEGELWY